jgi:hypothetical protein
MKTLRWLERFYGPIGRGPYAMLVFLFVDWSVGLYLHRHLTGIESWPWGPAWALIPFYLPLMVYLTLRRFLDAGWALWIAVPFSIVTLSPYLLLLRNHALSYWIPAGIAVVLQLPAMLVKGKKMPLAGNLN